MPTLNRHILAALTVYAYVAFLKSVTYGMNSINNAAIHSWNEITELVD